VALLGPRRGNLWLVNCYGQPMVMSLEHPGERRLGWGGGGDHAGHCVSGRYVAGSTWAGRAAAHGCVRLLWCRELRLLQPAFV
jgi:predicted oxidoreductase